MGDTKWLLCPVCKNKTRIRIRSDTILKKFPFVLPEVQTRLFSECSTVQYNDY